MNNHYYSLEYILLVLELIIEDKYLNFNKENIFRYSYCKVSLKALDDYITLILKKEKSKESLAVFIESFNIDPINIQQNLKISLPNYTQECKKDFSAIKDKKYKISPNVISMLFQQVFINGCILRHHDLRDYTAWTILFSELGSEFSTHQSSPKIFEKVLKTDHLQKILTTYLNHLCALGNIGAAQALHDFLHVAHLVVSQGEKNNITQNGLAKILSICVGSALELEGKMKKSLFIENSEPETETKPEPETKSEKKHFSFKHLISSEKKEQPIKPALKSTYTQELLQENNFFMRLIDYLLNYEQFHKPFSIKDYAPVLSDKFSETYKNIQNSLIKTLWAKPTLIAIPYVGNPDIFQSDPIAISNITNEILINFSPPKEELIHLSPVETISSSPRNEKERLINSGPIEIPKNPGKKTEVSISSSPREIPRTNNTTPKQSSLISSSPTIETISSSPKEDEIILIRSKGLTRSTGTGVRPLGKPDKIRRSNEGSDPTRQRPKFSDSSPRETSSSPINQEFIIPSGKKEVQLPTLPKATPFKNKQASSTPCFSSSDPNETIHTNSNEEWFDFSSPKEKSKMTRFSRQKDSSPRKTFLSGSDPNEPLISKEISQSVDSTTHSSSSSEEQFLFSRTPRKKVEPRKNNQPKLMLNLNNLPPNTKNDPSPKAKQGTPRSEKFALEDSDVQDLEQMLQNLLLEEKYDVKKPENNTVTTDSPRRKTSQDKKTLLITAARNSSSKLNVPERKEAHRSSPSSSPRILYTPLQQVKGDKDESTPFGITYAQGKPLNNKTSKVRKDEEESTFGMTNAQQDKPLNNQPSKFRKSDKK